MKPLSLFYFLILAAFSLSAAEPKITVKDIKIDKTLTNYVEGRIDERSGRTYKDWTVIIVELDVEIPDEYMNNRFEEGKWLDGLTVQWNFLYKPKKLQEHISNYMRFTRSVEFTNIEEGERSISILIDPDTMKRYFDSGNSFKNLLHSKIVVKHNGSLKDVKMFKGERESDDVLHKKMFMSTKTYLKNNILKTRLETPFRSIQTEKFLELSDK